MPKFIRIPAFTFLTMAALCAALGLELFSQENVPAAGDPGQFRVPQQLLEPRKGGKGGVARPLAWPRLPDYPTIRFVTSIPRPTNAPQRKTFFQRLRGILFSEPQESGMIRPLGVAGRDGMLYVTDPGARAIFLFDRQQESFQKITRAGKDLLVSPIGIALTDHRIFVSDSYLGRILIYDRRGGFRKTFTELQLERPTGLALDERSGRLYVAETGAHRILIYGRDGRLERSFGGRGTDKGQFNYPTHLWLDREGLLFIVDSLNFRIQMFRSDGGFVAEFGHHGDGSGDFASPKGIATDSRGHLYIVDALFDAVQIFDRQGQLLLPFGERGAGPGQFYLPAGLFIDEEDRIYVADSYNRRIQIFELAGEPGSGQ